MMGLIVGGLTWCIVDATDVESFASLVESLGESATNCGSKRRRTISCDGDRGQGRRSSCFQDWCSCCICTSRKCCGQKVINRGGLHVEDWLIKEMMRDGN